MPFANGPEIRLLVSWLPPAVDFEMDAAIGNPRVCRKREVSSVCEFRLPRSIFKVEFEERPTVSKSQLHADSESACDTALLFGAGRSCIRFQLAPLRHARKWISIRL